MEYQRALHNDWLILYWDPESFCTRSCNQGRGNQMQNLCCSKLYVFIDYRASPLEWHVMMTSSKCNIFRVTGPQGGEFTGHWWIPLTKTSDATLWCFLCWMPEQTVEQTVELRVICDALCDVSVMWTIWHEVLSVRLLSLLWGKSTGHRWVSLSKGQMQRFGSF